MLAQCQCGAKYMWRLVYRHTEIDGGGDVRGEDVANDGATTGERNQHCFKLIASGGTRNVGHMLSTGSLNERGRG